MDDNEKLVDDNNNDQPPETTSQETDGEPDTTPDAEDAEASDDAQDGEADAADDAGDQPAGPPEPPAHTDWSTLGPRLWNVLHNLMSGTKTKQDNKYMIEAADEHVGEAHDALDQ